MSIERKPIILTDSGSSMRPEYSQVQETGIKIMPLEVKFWENGQYVPYNDLKITPDEFYRRMKEGEKLPQTSGAVAGRMKELFTRLPKDSQAVSVHITSLHSVSFESGNLAKELVKEERPDLFIEVIDSRQLSICTWYLAEIAAQMAQKGASIEEIKAGVLENIPKMKILAAFETYENLKKGGRADGVAKAWMASLLSIYPIIGIKDAKIEQFTRERSPKKARGRIVEMVGDEGPLAKLSIVHANALPMAQEMKILLSKIFQGEIPIIEVGPLIGVHTGVGTVGVAFQKR